ncbi:SpoIIE family protein phosphatase [candidate division KSB1 bacterium]|nr:SpoIIE family protein phosphatase [candidate division KSB1 bacterium]
MSIRADMRIQGEKNFSEEMAPLFLRVDQRSNRDSLNEARRNSDHATNLHNNVTTVPILPTANGQEHASVVPMQLRTPRCANGNGLGEDATIFPYIPRKRQERNGLLIDYLYLPAPDAAGDQVDFLILGENRVGVLLADVSGKLSNENLPIIKTALRSNSAGLSTAATLRYLDQRLSEFNGNGVAITAFYAIFDQNKRLLHFASAGHLPMLLYRPASGKVFLLNTSGSPFGGSPFGAVAANVMSFNSASNGEAINDEGNNTARSLAVNDANTLKSERVALQQNDLLILYSDGLLAIRNAQEEYFGRQRLVDFVHKFSELNPTDFLVELKRTLEKFAGDRPTADDITVIAIKNVLRDLDKPHPEAAGHDLEHRFLTTSEEQSILEVLRENSKAGAAEILGRLKDGEYAYIQSEQIETYLLQLGRWLQPWEERSSRDSGQTTPGAGATGNNGVHEAALPTKKQFHEDLRAAFPLRQLLNKHYEFRGSSKEFVQALRHYENGDYEQALAEFARLRSIMRNSASMHCFFGNLHLLLNSPAKAQHEYLTALQLDPRCVHALLALSYVALLQDDYPAAIDSITTALRFNKNLSVYEQFAEKLIAAVARLENRNEWIV